MRRRRVFVAFLILAIAVSGPNVIPAADPPSPEQSGDATPTRVSYLYGEVSFWRPGAQEWAEAKTNTPLAPGDVLYTGADGNAELQIGPRAFVRAGNGTQIGLDNDDPDYVQFRVTAGHAAIDVREIPAGHTVEIDTPNAAFTIERKGYYHVDLAEDTTSFRAHRGGTATVTPAAGAATTVAANQQVAITGAETPSVETSAAPPLTAWDRWNNQRTTYLIQPANAQNVSPGMYGTEELAQHGTWRTEENYGPVWAPASVPSGWVPYSTGRWIWDPRFGWTWLDAAPWGWAPYHYGRWVFVRGYWGWAPGPVIVRPLYAPALVVFLGGPVAVAVRPVQWAPLGWGEPVIPVVGPTGIRRRCLVGRLGWPAPREQRGGQPHDHRQRDQHQRVQQRARAQRGRRRVGRSLRAWRRPDHAGGRRPRARAHARPRTTSGQAGRGQRDERRALELDTPRGGPGAHRGGNADSARLFAGAARAGAGRRARGVGASGKRAHRARAEAYGRGRAAGQPELRPAAARTRDA